MAAIENLRTVHPDERHGSFSFTMHRTSNSGSTGADLLSASQVLDTAALDPYLQVREAYRQNRWNAVHDGNPPEPDFFDKELFKD